MLRSYWRAIGIIVALAAVPALAQNINPIDEQASSETAPSEASSQPPSDAYPLAASSISDPLQRIASALEAANNEPEPAQETQRANRDLAAQEDMAFWAKLMFFGAAVEVIITGIGVWLVYVTFHATRTQLRIAEHANRLAEQRDFADQRPWIVLEGRKVTRIGFGGGAGAALSELSVHLETKLKNTGHTPALRVELRAELTDAAARPAVSAQNDLEAFCEKCRKTTTIGRSVALFPNTPERALPAVARRDGIDLQNPPLVMRLFLCATYMSSANSVQVMHTGVAVMLDVERLPRAHDSNFPSRVGKISLRDSGNIYSVS